MEQKLNSELYRVLGKKELQWLVFVTYTWGSLRMDGLMFAQCSGHFRSISAVMVEPGAGTRQTQVSGYCTLLCPSKPPSCLLPSFFNFLFSFPTCSLPPSLCLLSFCPSIQFIYLIHLSILPNIYQLLIKTLQ